MANGRTYASQYFVCGDATATLEGLVCRDRGPAEGCARLYRGIRRTEAQRRSVTSSSTLGAYGTFSEQLRKVMPRDAIWVRDVTQNNTTWGNRVFPLNAPQQNVYPVGAGIGQGLCLGIGAAAAAGDRKTVVMTGDGGFFLNVGELWTAVQENLDMTVIVMNDRGYGVIKRIQDATRQRAPFLCRSGKPGPGEAGRGFRYSILPGLACRYIWRYGCQGAGDQGADDGGSRYDCGGRVPAVLPVQSGGARRLKPGWRPSWRGLMRTVRVTVAVAGDGRVTVRSGAAHSNPDASGRL